MVKFINMKTHDLMKHFGCKTKKELSQKTGFSGVTLWKWEKHGIPPSTQAIFEIQTNGKLKADLQPLAV